jgi:hypothetical protein
VEFTCQFLCDSCLIPALPGWLTAAAGEARSHPLSTMLQGSQKLVRRVGPRDRFEAQITDLGAGGRQGDPVERGARDMESKLVVWSRSSSHFIVYLLLCAVLARVCMFIPPGYKQVQGNFPNLSLSHSRSPSTVHSPWPI